MEAMMHLDTNKMPIPRCVIGLAGLDAAFYEADAVKG